MEQNSHSNYSDEGWKKRGRKNKGKRQADSRHYEQDYMNFDPLKAVKAINITPLTINLVKTEKKTPEKWVQVFSSSNRHLSLGFKTVFLLPSGKPRPKVSSKAVLHKTR